MSRSVSRVVRVGRASRGMVLPVSPTPARYLSLMAHRPVPFFTPPPHKSPTPTPSSSPEAEVDDREWEMRVARGMLHLRETLPQLFTSTSSKDLFPRDVYSQNVVLRLPAPLPLRISSLQGYTVAFNIARNGLQALHSDLGVSLDRMTFSPAPSPSSPSAAAREALMGKSPPHRQKQIRVLLNITGIPRLPPHHEASWHTSSLYTFSPYSGLIAAHEVETIRPLPGEGVADWLMKSLLGWTGRVGDHEGAIPCPRAVKVDIDPRDRMSRQD